MNYLAHLFLSKNTPDSMLGNLLGDFVKGSVEGKFPPGIVEGIMNHRRVDLITDSDATVSSSRKLISEARCRFSGVIIDILYDHFLFRNWSLFSDVAVNEFIRMVYDNLSSHTVKIPPRAEAVIAKLVQEDWLTTYGTMEGIDKTFKRMSKRLKRENTLDSAVEELQTNYSTLNAHFLRFFPLLIHQIRKQ